MTNLDQIAQGWKAQETTANDTAEIVNSSKNQTKKHANELMGAMISLGSVIPILIYIIIEGAEGLPYFTYIGAAVIAFLVLFMVILAVLIKKNKPVNHELSPKEYLFSLVAFRERKKLTHNLMTYVYLPGLFVLMMAYMGQFMVFSLAIPVGGFVFMIVVVAVSLIYSKRKNDRESKVLNNVILQLSNPA